MAERQNRTLRLSGDGLWLMLIHFPTGDVAAGVFARNFFGALFSSFLPISLKILLGTWFWAASLSSAITALVLEPFIESQMPFCKRP